MENLIFLAEYELESYACLEEGLNSANLHHPENKYSVELRNKNVEIGTEFPTLTAYLTFEASSFDDAKIKGEEYIKEYVDMLTFSTNIHFEVNNLLKLADWTPGKSERECFIYNVFPGDDRPYPLLKEELLKSIEFLLEANITPLFRRALKWFSNGVSAKYWDDQFQYFWFVLELLSQVYKKTEKVNDTCPKCRSSLYCETCEEHPKHRPYPKQSIKHLFSLMVKKEEYEETFEILNKIRNSLMHGDEIKSIEDDLEIDFSEYVDKLGQIAWITIFNTFANSFKEPKKQRLSLLQSSTYCGLNVTAGVHMKFASSDPNNPKPEEIPSVEIDILYSEKQEEDKAGE